LLAVLLIGNIGVGRKSPDENDFTYLTDTENNILVMEETFIGSGIHSGESPLNNKHIQRIAISVDFQKNLA